MIYITTTNMNTADQVGTRQDLEEEVEPVKGFVLVGGGVLSISIPPGPDHYPEVQGGSSHYNWLAYLVSHVTLH